MKNWRALGLYLLVIVFGISQRCVWSQAVSITWPLTANTAGASVPSTLATASPEVISGGTAPTVSVFDYASGVAQRLNAGSTGWTAGPVSMNRYLQFDAAPTAGNQLTVTSVSFNYGRANVNNQIQSQVRYSTDNWSTSTVLAPALSYSPTAMTPFTANLTIPAIPSGGRFSLRIFPYAVTSSMAGAPTFAAHNQVRINGTSSPVSVPQVRLHITKSTGGTVVPGNYLFNVTCTGPGGPYTGINPVSVPLPGPTVITQVPQGDTCTLTETSVSGWQTPIWGGSNSPVNPNGWSAQIGPMNVNTTLTVTNRPPTTVPQVRLQITKSTGGTVVPGNYVFNVSCTGPGGPYTGPNPVTVTLPGGPVITQVPQGDTCTLTETSISGWQTPIWGGSNSPVNPNGWSAQIGPMNVNTTLTVTNRPSVPQVRLQITKSTGANVVPGTYHFNVSCTGPGGPYTGPNPVNVTLPGGPVITQVPQGDTCTLIETQVSGWGNPIWGGSNSPVNPNGWSAQVGPMNVNTTLTVTNQPATTANFRIEKKFQGTPVAGTYTFNISCTGGYTGPGTVTVVTPNPGFSAIQVPSGATCQITENPVSGWNTPIIGGSSWPVNPNLPWGATVGPMQPSGNVGDRVQFTNRP